MAAADSRHPLSSWLRFAAVTALGMIALSSEAFADNRVALVIGNGTYAHVPRLPNPTNDAEDVAAALRRTGFEVILGTDLDQSGMLDATIRFARAARAADVAVFYYSGHAMQYAGINYLIPIDARLRDEADLRRMARVDDILVDLQQAKNLRILVLDSCRDNPLVENLKRSIGSTRSVPLQRGLARIESPEGMIVAYATQAGKTADDGVGRNSPYTTSFLKHIEEREDIVTIFRRISADVYRSTRRAQLPELALSFIGEFYLNGRLQATATPPLAPDLCSAASDHWKSAVAIGTLGALQDHLARYPNCAFAGLANVQIEVLKQKQATAKPEMPQPDEKAPIADLGLLREIRERLYELNFDPGPFDAPFGEAARQSVREFEASNKLPLTGQPSLILLRKLRDVGELKPWGALVYSKGTNKWGISWGQSSRRLAVASARSSCGDATVCSIELSFFGTECGAFAHSAGAFSLAARSGIQRAREVALADCGKRGKTCRIIASVCADGGGRTAVNN